jgi:hypothetical protein
MNKVQFELGAHNGQKVIFIKFDYNVDLIARVN